MNILEEYKKIVTHYLDAPDVFVEASGYHIISALLGKFFRCSFIPGGSFGARPNIWFIIASIPGRTRRSTLANYSTYTYKTTLQKYFMEVLDDCREDSKKAKSMVSDSIIEEGTPEGITDHIEVTKLDAYAIMSTEFGSVLKRMSSKDYELGVSSLFSKIYYGEPGTMMLSARNKDAGGASGRKRSLPEGLYTTMFCGMQEPHIYLTPDMSRQGLLRRIILVYCDPSDIERWMPPLNEERENVWTDLWNLTEKILEKMLDYRQKASMISPYLLDVTFHNQALNLINTYAKEADDALVHEVSNLNVYQQSFWEHLAKLAMLNAIGRDGVHDIGGEWAAFVTLEDTRKAKDFLDKATKYSRDIISNLGSLDEPIKTSRDSLERVYQIIASNPDGILRADLYKRANMKSNLLQELLNTLQLQERVVREERISSGGRPPVYYKIKEE